MQIIFWSGTKCLRLAQYLNKFLARHKKFGLAQNILGPVKGQGIKGQGKVPDLGVQVPLLSVQAEKDQVRSEVSSIATKPMIEVIDIKNNSQVIDSTKVGKKNSSIENNLYEVKSVE